MISCQELFKRFGNVKAAAGVSFRVPTGSVCALVGPNGAGKSTVLRILAGLLAPSSGAAEVCGFKANDPALKWKVGILPESLALFDLLTIAEHLDLTGAVYKLRPAETSKRRDQLLSGLRLEDGRRTLIQDCSFGMKKKTALAMALMPNPAALFLDEPFEGIDPVTAETIRLQLRAIAKRGITVLLTSHILSMVDRVADQVILINHGTVVFDSPVSDLPRDLDQLYLEFVERSPEEQLGWLGSAAP